MSTLYLLSFGPVDPDLMRDIATETSRVLGMAVGASSTQLDIPKRAYDSSRQQHISDILLTELLRNRPAPRATVLGVTEADLYTEGLNFVFGQADMSRGVAVISLARLRPAFWGRPPDELLLLERAVKEAVHELGHTFGLHHCPSPDCVMHFSNTLGDTDRKGREFCPSCRRALAAR